MSNAIVDYDKPLPEIPGRCPWEPPSSFLVRDIKTDSGWREDTSGRRPSQLLLTTKLRQVVEKWRQDNYPGASAVTQSLFQYWFEEDHIVPGYNVPFRYHYCQREAIETLAYLVEIAGVRDAKLLVQSFATIVSSDLLNKNIDFRRRWMVLASSCAMIPRRAKFTLKTSRLSLWRDSLSAWPPVPAKHG